MTGKRKESTNIYREVPHTELSSEFFKAKFGISQVWSTLVGSFLYMGG